MSALCDGRRPRPERGPTRRRLLDRLDADPPERDVGRIHDQPAQRVFGVGRHGIGADQVLAPLRDFGFGLHEIERRDLAGIDPHLVFARQLLRQLERPLLHRHVGARRLQRPVRLLDGGDGLDGRLRKRRSELSWFRFAIVYWCRAESIVRSLSSGCENAS